MQAVAQQNDVWVDAGFVGVDADKKGDDDRLCEIVYWCFLWGDGLRLLDLDGKAG